MHSHSHGPSVFFDSLSCSHRLLLTNSFASNVFHSCSLSSSTLVFFLFFSFRTRSCGGGVRSAWTEAAGCRLSAQQQSGGALHEGGQELRPSRGAVQEGPGAGAGHGDKVRVARTSAEVQNRHESLGGGGESAEKKT